MKKSDQVLLVICLTILSVFIGFAGIGVLIVVGEGTNNTLIAIVSVVLPIAVLAFLFSLGVPRGRWAFAIALSAPAGLFMIISAWSSRYLGIGGILTILLAFVGAYEGAWLRTRRAAQQQNPPA